MPLKIPKICYRLVWMPLVLIFLAGCATKTPFQRYEADRTESVAAAEPRVMGDSVSRYGALKHAALTKAPAPPSPSAKDAVRPPKQKPSDKRMLHHNGYMKLRTPKPKALLDQAVDLVQAHGGYVERLDAKSAVLRVPVKKFNLLFKKLLTLGDVLDKSITTQDITDKFLDADLRLKIAKTTRKRLVALLAKARTEKEKIRLLREIQRISEKIEYLTGQRDHLLALARYSRITIEVVSRKMGRYQPKREAISAMVWIHDLTPFSHSVTTKDKYLAFTAPKGMVVLDHKKRWVAESADGVVFRAGNRKNKLEADADFWTEAIRIRLAQGFASYKAIEAGDFKLLVFQSRSDKTYFYAVGVHVAKNKRLHIVEIYYPSLKHKQRHEKAIMDSIKEGAR